ncbi:MAG: alkaline phosphatase D family protein, partial [Pirellulaceae bacterium]
MTHGPILGGLSEDGSISIWARTSAPTSFEVRFAPKGQPRKQVARSEATEFEHDCTGYVELSELQPETEYAYQVYVAGYPQGSVGRFRTLPNPGKRAEAKYNPGGLYNFAFEIGSCANQNPMHGIGHSLPLYETMNHEIAGQVDFAIMNGDWLYEELRDTPPSVWQAKNRLPDDEVPKVVQQMPSIVGVWENYKLYMSRGVPLMDWHQRVPSFFTFDDHELVNDIWGAGSPGRRHRRTVFRDIGTQAWYDYLGWANPTEHDAGIHFGVGSMRQGSDLLHDPNADFDKLPLGQLSNLHVHWGGLNAGVNESQFDDDSGEPNSKVYAIEEVVDARTLRLHEPAVASGNVNYSIGRRNYGSMRVANCEILFLDTRSHRDMHDVRQPDKPGLSMLGYQQRDWLEQTMRESDAEFFFVVSSVPMFIPHSGAGGFEFD